MRRQETQISRAILKIVIVPDSGVFFLLYSFFKNQVGLAVNANTHEYRGCTSAKKDVRVEKLKQESFCNCASY